MIKSDNMPEFNYQKICENILSLLPQRQREVIERRYGLNGREKETLQAIGNDFTVSRERIRQIENNGFLQLQSQKERKELKDIFSFLNQYLQKQGGVKREDVLLRDIGGNDSQNNVYFLLNFIDSFFRFPEDEIVYSFWAVQKDAFQKVKEIIAKVVMHFEKIKEPLLQDELVKLNSVESLSQFFSSIEIAKNIERGPLNDFGLVVWPTIKPRGVRDGVYLVLKKTKAPLHFKQIADFSVNLEGDFFKRKKVLPQTVHNELIKDERFVLVGRGIYALKEWGYVNGTVKDVLLNIFKEDKTPLSRDEILKEVQKQRFVKSTTVFLNLANKNYFFKDGDGKYTLKTSLA